MRRRRPVRFAVDPPSPAPAPQPQPQPGSGGLLFVIGLILLLALAQGGIVTPPGPVVPPAPVVADKLIVLVVEETGERHKLPASQLSVLTSLAVREYVASKSGEMRIYDPQADLKNEAGVWRDAMAVPRQSLPWLVVSNGKAGFSGPLPATVDDTLTLLRKYGG